MLRPLFVACLLAASAFAGCAGPCEELANIVCDCEEDPVQRQACRNQVTADAGRIRFSENDTAFCKGKLKTCGKDCAALRRGDRGACGFYKESPN